MSISSSMYHSPRHLVNRISSQHLVAYEPHHAPVVLMHAPPPPPPVVQQTVYNVVHEEPPLALYKDTLEGCIMQMQAQVAELQNYILEERRTRNHGRHSIHDERQARHQTDIRISTLVTELKACKDRFAMSNHEWWHGHQDLRKSLDKIEARRSVQVDMCNGHVHMLRPINFKHRVAGDAPTAEFSEPRVADDVCRDLAEVAILFGCPVQVDGHTKGGATRFWQALSENRAQLVADKLIGLGVDKNMVTTAGYPGHLGLKDARVEVTLRLPNFGGQPVSSNMQMRRFEHERRRTAVRHIRHDDNSFTEVVEHTPNFMEHSPHFVTVDGDGNHVIHRSPSMRRAVSPSDLRYHQPTLVRELSDRTFHKPGLVREPSISSTWGSSLGNSNVRQSSPRASTVATLTSPRSSRLHAHDPAYDAYDSAY